MLNKKLRSEQQSVASLNDWLHSFNKIYAEFNKEIGNEVNFYARAYRQKFLLQQIATRYYNRLLANRPNEQSLRQLYRIHAGLATLEKMNASFQSLKHTQDDDYAYDEFSRLIHAIIDEVLTLGETRLPQSVTDLLAESIPRFDILLRFRVEYQYLSMLLYRNVWTTLFNRDEWIKQQEKKLTEQLPGLASNWLAPERKIEVALPMALIHLAFLRGDDDLAMQRAEQLQDGHVNAFFYMIELTEKSSDMERMLAWLHVAKDELKPFLIMSGQYQLKRDYCDFLLHYYSIYAEKTHTPDVYVTALKQLLPYSFSEYNDHLFHHEEYRAWVELQLLVGFQPEIHAQTKLREIELADRASLLPLYHQAVQQAIDGKNRSAYKLAVKRLKKLRTHYRQLKKVDMWDTYIGTITKKHRRLRAFQDELRKGKLIHD